MALPPGTTVQNYLVFAILATVFCCLPAGIPAIIYAAQVNGKLQAGDVAGAQVASNNAKMWCLISLGLGLGIVALYAIMIMLGLLSGFHQH
ncbi:MAG TPA: CD225/dispanin family protein [Candidatus Acidoferrum sp.]|nr:CD225/dispanin family protein [Candidatus Acidoferrum sp.]